MPEQIPLEQLAKGRYYVGRGRNGNVGAWDGRYFLVVRAKFDEYTLKHERYYTEELGTFQPFALIDEGVMVEPFGKLFWDEHYGRRLEFMGQVDPKAIHVGMDLIPEKAQEQENEPPPSPTL